MALEVGQQETLLRTGPRSFRLRARGLLGLQLLMGSRRLPCTHLHIWVPSRVKESHPSHYMWPGPGEEAQGGEDASAGGRGLLVTLTGLLEILARDI